MNKNISKHFVTPKEAFCKCGHSEHDHYNKSGPLGINCGCDECNCLMFSPRRVRE